MARERKNRREKPDRRSGTERRAKQTPVEVERRKKRDRRTGLTRRFELQTAGDQIQAARDLFSRVLQHGVLSDEDRWLLETAIARLRSALEPLGPE